MGNVMWGVDCRYVFFSGCGKSDEKKILGTWYEINSYSGEVDYDEDITFYEDGEFYGFDEDGSEFKYVKG